MDLINEENDIRRSAVDLMQRSNRGLKKDQFYAEISLLILQALLLIANCIRQQR
jgi:hypothetical protein